MPWQAVTWVEMLLLIHLLILVFNLRGSRMAGLLAFPCSSYASTPGASARFCSSADVFTL